ncbi:hypothetical protein Tco_0332949 [Tanacetum coccineum]
MVPPNNLGLDLAGKLVNETSYRGMIGSLMHLTATRPDIQFSTVLCVRYQSNPKESHLTAVKRILRYLKGTLTLGLYYPKCSGFDLKGYLDPDYAGCNMDRKSTSGACQTLGGKLVCWSAKKQQSVAMSSAEAEYVAVAGCCASILWIKSQLSDYDIHYKMLPIFCDNTSAIAISNNPVLHSRTKHIDIRYHFIRDHILKGDIELHFIPTEYHLADIFTKPLDEPTFSRLKVELGIIELNFPQSELPRQNPSPEKLFSHGLENSVHFCDSGALSKKIKRPKSKKPPTKTKVTPPKPTEGSEQSHLVSSGTVPDPQDLERNIQLASVGLSSTLDEGTLKTKPLLESTATPPKDPGENIKPLDRDITSTTSAEGTAKTTPRPEGLLRDKDLGGNIPPADMEPIHLPVADLSGTGAKYH